MADNSSIWSNVGTVATPLIQGAGSGISASQVAAANAEAASGVKTAGANSAALLNPYAAQGTAAETQLANLYGLNGSGAQAGARADFADTPGYQFTAKMGDQAIQRQAAATGGEFSSATLGALDQYNTGLAQNTYQNYVSNLFGLVQPGAGAAAASGSQGIAAATAAGNFTVGKGQANASGVQGVQGALTDAMGNPNTYAALRRLFNGGGGGGGGQNYDNRNLYTNGDIAPTDPAQFDEWAAQNGGITFDQNEQNLQNLTDQNAPNFDLGGDSAPSYFDPNFL